MKLKPNGHATGHVPIKIRNNILMRDQYTLHNADTDVLLATINADSTAGKLLVGALAIGTEIMSIELIDETINITDNTGEKGELIRNPRYP